MANVDPWSPFLEKHAGALILYARQWVDCHADAEDVVQDGFVRYWRSSPGREDIGLLFSCVRTAALDFARRESRMQKREELFARQQITVTPSVSTEQQECIETALLTLPLEQREVLVMKIWGGLTFAEIAGALKISPNTAASRYRYGIEALQGTLKPEVLR